MAAYKIQNVGVLEEDVDAHESLKSLAEMIEAAIMKATGEKAYIVGHPAYITEGGPPLSGFDHRAPEEWCEIASAVIEQGEWITWLDPDRDWDW